MTGCGPPWGLECVGTLPLNWSQTSSLSYQGTIAQLSATPSAWLACIDTAMTHHRHLLAVLLLLLTSQSVHRPSFELLTFKVRTDYICRLRVDTCSNVSFDAFLDGGDITAASTACSPVVHLLLLWNTARRISANYLPPVSVIKGTADDHIRTRIMQYLTVCWIFTRATLF